MSSTNLQQPKRSLPFWLPLSVVVFAASAVLLFYGLGHYPLWCDEADTALYARGVARTGDTHAVIDHNIYAYRSGTCLNNLCGRFVPPASFYLAAPFVGKDGTSSFWPRFPFAVCGLLSVALMLYWMASSNLSWLEWVVYSLGLLGNVSFFLYNRQCRYYALASLLSLIVAYLYLHWNGRPWKLVALMVASILLMWTQYLPFAGLYAALACDYFVFRRHVPRLTKWQWLLLLGPQFVAGILAVSIYNPIGTEAVQDLLGRNVFVDKLILFWRYLRDMNACEYGVGLLMLAAPALYFLDKNVWLLRGPLAIFSYTLLVTLLSPQPVSMTFTADIRYLSSIIPLCIFLGALALLTLSRWKWYIALPLALVCFGSNIVNEPLNYRSWRSTIYLWVQELGAARETAIQQTVKWIDANVRDGQSMLVLPDYMMYPLMYHAPQAVYAWQLRPPASGQFAGFAPIHFAAGTAPDYILTFGVRPESKQIRQLLEKRNVEYALLGGLDTYWDEMTRPELFSHAFKPPEKFDRQANVIYIWERKAPAPKGEAR